MLKNLLKNEIKFFYEWQHKAELGFKFIPKRYLVPIKTASDMYVWTIDQIVKDPMIVFTKKVKPSVLLILKTILKNFLTIYLFRKNQK